MRLCCETTQMLCCYYDVLFFSFFSFFLFLLLFPLSHLLLARASSPWKPARSTSNFSTRLTIVSVLIATFFWNLIPVSQIRSIWNENVTRDSYLSEKLCRLTGVAATACPPRHSGGGEIAAAAAAAAATNTLITIIYLPGRSVLMTPRE